MKTQHAVTLAVVMFLLAYLFWPSPVAQDASSSSVLAKTQISTKTATGANSTPPTSAQVAAPKAGAVAAHDTPASTGNVITKPSGLQYEILVEGSGAEATPGHPVVVNYTGTLTDGTKFDSSVGRGPFTFDLGKGMVIPGWDEGVDGMKVGEKRKLIIPSVLGYGPRGAGGVIPPNATLIFEVELLDVR